MLNLKNQTILYLINTGLAVSVNLAALSMDTLEKTADVNLSQCIYGWCHSYNSFTKTQVWKRSSAGQRMSLRAVKSISLVLRKERIQVSLSIYHPAYHLYIFIFWHLKLYWSPKSPAAVIPLCYSTAPLYFLFLRMTVLLQVFRCVCEVHNVLSSRYLYHTYSV